MKQIYYLTVFGLLIGLVSQAQTADGRFFNNIEPSIESGAGGGGIGLQLKANHSWISKEKLTLQSGLSFSSFWGSERIDDLAAKSSGFSTDNHLRLYTGIITPIAKKIYLGTEGYLGGYHAFTNGNLTSDTYQIDADFRSSQGFFDFGTRLSFGYQLREQVSIQATVNNSWKQAGIGLGLLAGLFAGEPDGKMSLGIGVKFNL
jgi:hypothetical protein